MIYLILFFIAALTSCNSPTPDTPSHWVNISGRSDQNHTSREPIYRLKVPPEWKLIAPPDTDPLVDTTKALFEIEIQDLSSSSAHQKIQLTFHNFPVDHKEDQIPPLAQIARWKRQINPDFETTIPQSFAGFYGFLYEAENQENAIMAWSMLIDPEHYQSLEGSKQYSDQKSKQMRSAWTLKAIGPKRLMQELKDAIYQSIRTLELIDEVKK